MGVDSRILQAVGELGFESPMAVQQQVIPFLLHETRDVIALAQTGTGKTAAFGIPIIQRINPASAKTQALILAPTRELCIQITGDLKRLASYMGRLTVVPIYGGADIVGQIRQVAAGAQIVVATPGRMLDMLTRKKIDVSAIDWLVLDEADEMLDMGFKEDLDAILAGTPERKRVLLFSATMARGVEAIAAGYMKSPKAITVGLKNAGADTIRHQYCVVHAKDRYAALRRIADYHPGVYAIIFCRTRQETQEIADALIRDGYNADALHGDLSQTQRDHVMKRFRGRQLQMLVATDVAARGLDVSSVTHIINYNLPDDVENYTHRSGRTGRAGRSGISVVIVNLKEVYRIRQIERQIGKSFEVIRIPTGREICEKQLLHLADRVRETEMASTEMEAFLPTLYERFQGFSKEEVIRRFIAADANRFLADYRDAADLNVAPKKEKEKGTGREKEKSALRAVPASARLVINLGQVDRFTDRSFRTYLLEKLNLPTLKVEKLEVTRNRSFFEIDAQAAPYVIARLERKKFQGRRILIDYADRGERQKDFARPQRDTFRATNAFMAKKRKRSK